MRYNVLIWLCGRCQKIPPAQCVHLVMIIQRLMCYRQKGVIRHPQNSHYQTFRSMMMMGFGSLMFNPVRIKLGLFLMLVYLLRRYLLARIIQVSRFGKYFHFQFDLTLNSICWYQYIFFLFVDEMQETSLIILVFLQRLHQSILCGALIMWNSRFMIKRSIMRMKEL